MNLASQIRHFLAFLAGLGTLFLSWHIIAPDQVEAVNKAGGELISPLVIILGAVGACVFRAALTWIYQLFRTGAGETETKTGGSGGSLPLWVLMGTLAGCMGFLPACSSAQWAAARAIPIRIGIQGPDAALNYSAKAGLELNAVIRAEK
jgi:hypothetical protein